MEEEKKEKESATQLEQPGLNRDQSVSLIQKEMTSAELAKHQSAEDESMRKF